MMAADDIYLRTDFRGSSQWDSDEAVNKFTYVETNASNEDVYTLTINASDIKTSDVWFRIHISGWGAQICPYTSSSSYTFTFGNGQNETYGAKYEKTYFQGSSLSFGISHSTIKANQYKITLFRGNNDQYYESETCKVMWIKVEIVNMPVSITDVNGYRTFSCNRALDFTDTDITAYIATANGANSITLSKVTTIAANQGLFLSGSTDNIPVIETIDAPATNLLKAGDDATHVTSGTTYCYVFANGTQGYGFYNLSVAKTVAKGKAYLEYTSSSAPDFIGIDLENPTGISTIQMNTTMSKDGIYNLSGQRVVSPSKGLYIMNGKKVIIK